jgi:hypothetical protein
MTATAHLTKTYSGARETSARAALARACGLPSRLADLRLPGQSLVSIKDQQCGVSLVTWVAGSVVVDKQRYVCPAGVA